MRHRVVSAVLPTTLLTSSRPSRLIQLPGRSEPASRPSRVQHLPPCFNNTTYYYQYWRNSINSTNIDITLPRASTILLTTISNGVTQSIVLILTSHSPRASTILLTTISNGVTQSIVLILTSHFAMLQQYYLLLSVLA